MEMQPLTLWNSSRISRMVEEAIVCDLVESSLKLIYLVSGDSLKMNIAS